MAVKTSAAEAAANWATGTAAAGPKYIKGVQAVRTSPTQLAAAASARWAANVAASRPKFEANLNKVSLQQWQNSAATVGAANLATGVQKGTPKVEAVMPKLIQNLTNVVNSLPARGDVNANKQRVLAFIDGMHATKGSY